MGREAHATQYNMGQRQLNTLKTTKKARQGYSTRDLVRFAVGGSLVSIYYGVRVGWSSVQE